MAQAIDLCDGENDELLEIWDQILEEKESGKRRKELELEQKVLDPGGGGANAEVEFLVP